MGLQHQDFHRLDTLGGRIRASRKARHLTILAAARSVGISRVSFSQWEADAVKQPTLGKLLAFTKLVDVGLEWLLERRGPDPKILRPPKGRASRR